MQKITNSVILTIFLFSLYSCKKEKISPSTHPHIEVADPPKTEHAKLGETNKTVDKYKKFSGAWFDIEYPATFTAENSLKSLTNAEGFDSALFSSPDGKVQFYVFSPQWSGEASDISVKPGERIKETSEEKRNGLFVKRWTVEANDGSYRRSYEESSEKVSETNKVFGIRYATETDLKKYMEEYQHFKGSLKQYAD